MRDTRSIEERMHSWLVPNNSYVLHNVYVYNWESDIFAITTSGYAVDYEIKTSKSDFKADFAKADKHDVLKTGSFNERHRTYNGVNTITGKSEWVDKFVTKERRRPNRFYYVMPENLVDIADIPNYAGLIYVDKEGALAFIKQAPLLHKNKYPEPYKLIAYKCYHQVLGFKRERALLMTQRANDKREMTRAVEHILSNYIDDDNLTSIIYRHGSKEQIEKYNSFRWSRILNKTPN